MLLAVFRKAVRAGFPSPADDYLDAPIDLSRALIQNAPATFIMTVAGDSAIDAGIFDGSLITVDRSLRPRDGDPVVVDVNGERSVKIFRLVGGRSCLAFAFGEERPTAFFAGIWARQWTSVRKVKSGEETIDLFAFLTTDPNAEVGAIHPKAMPVILTTPEECEAWMTAPWEQAKVLQRPLQNGSLDIVARGVKKDGESDTLGGFTTAGGA
ncbi:S24 family peptidase [Bosea sp. MMO-172]|uniref:S24 family peptidase n=1 Tax=Bosea sp. MMO-172 TaxID=3127885 RepID=UPI00301B4E7B